MTDFQRSIRIGHPVDQERISAKLEDGLLTVELPKAEIAKPKTIEIR
jgi:HSP20 family protein